MRIVLIGAVGGTRVALEALSKWRCGLTAVATLPPERASRHSDFEDLRPLAGRLGVEVIDVVNVNAPAFLETLRGLRPDLVMVIGWSQLCGDEFLSIARLGTIGFHPAPLPRMRGRAVIPWTILEGERETGASLFWMDAGMDSGDLLAQRRFPVRLDETATTLYARHEACIADLLADVEDAVLAGAAPRLPQNHALATYCARRTADDGEINWREPAERIWTLIRAVTRPYPGAFTRLRGHVVRIWAADLVPAAPYIGLPGQVQTIDHGAWLVRCGDGQFVRVTACEVEADGPGEIPAIERHTTFDRAPWQA